MYLIHVLQTLRGLINNILTFYQHLFAIWPGCYKYLFLVYQNEVLYYLYWVLEKILELFLLGGIFIILFYF